MSQIVSNDFMANSRSIIEAIKPVPRTQVRPVKPVQPVPVLRTVGLKRALLIGINYVKTPHELYGCINDVNNIMGHLKTQFPSCKEYKTLTDLTDEKPTRANILKAIQWLVTGLKPGEHVFLHYSGHGSRVRDMNKDEVSGLDSCIIPINNGKMEVIIDDELRIHLANAIPAGSKCFVVLDCCNSGTALDLRYCWQSVTTTTMAYREQKQYPATTGQVIFLSGCHDVQYAADTVKPDGTASGALTWALIETWKKYGTTLKLKHILWDVHAFLKEYNYQQLPQLSFGKYEDINSVLNLHVA